jgi:hypothetical protein
MPIGRNGFVPRARHQLDECASCRIGGPEKPDAAAGAAESISEANLLLSLRGGRPGGRKASLFSHFLSARLQINQRVARYVDRFSLP